MFVKVSYADWLILKWPLSELRLTMDFFAHKILLKYVCTLRQKSTKTLKTTIIRSAFIKTKTNIRQWVKKEK